MRRGRERMSKMKRRILRTTLFVAAALLLSSARLEFAADSTGSYPPPAEVKAAFLKLLDRPKIALDPQITRIETLSSGFVAVYLTIATERKADGSIERSPSAVGAARQTGGATSRRDCAARHGRQQRPTAQACLWNSPSAV